MRWFRLIAKALAALLFAVLCAFVPITLWLPLPDWLVRLQCSLVGFVLVVYIGKLCFDTLFYDHYWP